MSPAPSSTAQSLEGVSSSRSAKSKSARIYRTARSERCPCGNGKSWRQCCGSLQQLKKLGTENGLTDAYMADRFVAYHGNDVRYIHDTDQWLTFRPDTHRWLPADPGEPTRLAIENARAFLREARHVRDDKSREKALSFAKYCQGAPGIRRVLKIVQDSTPVATSSKAWNADPWLVGASNGIIDLRTGALLQSGRDHHITMSLGVPYESQAPEPTRWIQFLYEVFRDGQMVDYLQRVCGYSLTGVTSEQIWWLLYGAGSNGKSVLLNILTFVMGDYAKTVSFKLFERTAQRPSVGDGTEQLVHKRFVSARETVDGAHLDEQRLKTLTGGDDVPARGLYTSYMEFKPELKLFLCANHKPVVRDDTFGFWRRVNVVTFPNLFVDEPTADNERKRDDRLEDTLKAEASGILAWMVQGARAWQQNGLRAPRQVLDATAAYQVEANHMGPFIQECCEPAPDATCSSSSLHGAYERWAIGRGIPKSEWYSFKEFGTRLKKRFQSHHTNVGTMYVGLRLRPT